MPGLVPVVVHPGEPAVADSLTLKVPVGHWPVVLLALQVTLAVVAPVATAREDAAQQCEVSRHYPVHTTMFCYNL